MVWGVLAAVLQPVLGLASSIQAIKIKPKPAVLPVGLAPHPASTREQVEAAIQQLDPQSWVTAPASKRAALLDRCMHNLVDAAPEVARLSVQAKGAYGAGLGEEMIAMFPVVLALKEYCITLKWAGRQRPVAVRNVPGTNQQAAQVFPWGMLAALLPGTTAEVWMEPGKPASDMALLYKRKAAGELGEGGVSAVLGAGNQYAVVLLDIFHKLIADDEVVCCKMSPVNEYVGPVFEKALAPLVEANALRFLYGGREVGEQLVSHPRIKSVHLTGSADTCNAIIWGSPSAPRTGTPPLTKAITAELGNVTPFIVAPGEWSDADLRFHAQSVVTGLVHNASHNCVAGEILVTDAAWPQRKQFLEEVRRQLAAAPQRCAYYPGSDAKRAAFNARMTGHKVQELGVPVAGGPGAVGAATPWLLVEGLTAETAQLQQENWFGALQEVALDSSSGGGGGAYDAARFLQLAEEFVNAKVWGSLSIAVWVHPRTQKQLGPAFDAFLSKLRYGHIAINAPALIGFGITSLPWGAAPGNTLQDVESGIGFVHNTWLFEHAAKGVVHMPWRPVPKPMYFADNYATEAMAPHLLRTLARLDTPLRALPEVNKLVAAAVRG